MKKQLLLWIGLALSYTGYTQPFPDCNTLLVSSAAMDNDTADLVKVTLKSTCSNCASGINGCVYMEMRVIRTVAPFDTLARSACYCLMLPPNNGQMNYSLYNANVTSLPLQGQFRVSARFCGCDTIPFEQSVSTGLAPGSRPETIGIFPSQDYLIISRQASHFLSVLITNASGTIVHQGKINRENERIYVGGYAPGLYLVRVADESAQLVKTFRFIRP